MSTGGGPNDPSSIPLATRRKRWILNRQRQEIPPGKRRAIDARWSSAHPDARLRSSATATYNCVAMVFASRRTWVNTDQIAAILSDDGYKKVDEFHHIDIGDLVTYHDNADGGVTHIGIIMAHQRMPDGGQHAIEVMSKWGAAGEYLHKLEDVPDDYGEAAHFWTDRR